MTLPLEFGTDCSPQDLVARIDGWLCGTPMERLVRLFSPDWDVRFEPTKSFYDSLVQFVDEAWNSRGVVTTERYATKYKEVPPDLHDEVGFLAHELGLTASSVPSHERYDVILAPGSQFWPMVVRVGYMLELRRLGVLSDMYVGLGSRRSLYTGEIEALKAFSLTGVDEYGLMQSIVQRIFAGTVNFDDFDSLENNRSSSISYRVTFHDTASSGSISMMCTENIDGRRPTTGDTLETWLKGLGRLSTVRRILVITQPLFLYQQGAVAIDLLGLKYGLDVEVVGAADLEYIEGFRFPTMSAAQILQEVNGSVKRLVALRSRLVEMNSLGERVETVTS